MTRYRVTFEVESGLPEWGLVETYERLLDVEEGSVEVEDVDGKVVERECMVCAGTGGVEMVKMSQGGKDGGTRPPKIEPVCEECRIEIGYVE